MKGRRRLRWRRAGIMGAPVLAVGLVAGLLVNGIGPGTGNSPPTVANGATGGPLCAVAGKVDGLVISRVESLDNGETFTFPAHVTVAEPQQARAVARVLCALPVTPRRALLCPNDWGLDYRLAFSTGDSEPTPVTVDVTGCQTVNGLGGRWILGPSASAFWRVLAVAAGLTPADQSTFAGTLP